MTTCCFTTYAGYRSFKDVLKPFKTTTQYRYIHHTRLNPIQCSQSAPQDILDKEHVDTSQEESAYYILQNQLKDVLQGHKQASLEVDELNHRLEQLEESLQILNEKEMEFSSAFKERSLPKKLKVKKKPREVDQSVDRSKVVKKVRKVVQKDPETSQKIYEEIPQQQLQSQQVVIKSQRERRVRGKGVAVQPVNKALLSAKKKKGADSNPNTLYSKFAKTNLLKSEEEKELNQFVKRLQEFEEKKKEYVSKRGIQPSPVEWAALCGYDYPSFMDELEACLQAKQRFIDANMRLVVSVAKKYASSEFTIQELMQDGYQGLVRAVEKFDSSKGFRFSTYAHWWVRQSINRGMVEHGRVVRLPTYYFEQYSKMKKYADKFESENDRPPTDKELAQIVNLTVERIRQIRQAMQNPTSLQSQIAGKEDGASMEELIEDEGDKQDPEQKVFQKMMHKDIEAALNGLSPKERMIIKLRYGINGGRPHTLEEIGRLLNLTRERVRQIEIIAKENLRDPQKNKQLYEYTQGGMDSKKGGARRGVRRE